MKYFAGQPHPLGSRICRHDGLEGVNFAVFSQHARRMELCLFTAAGEKRYSMQRSGNIWHCFISDIGAGMHYGYRANGVSNPRQGHYFNPQKLLLDPYAKQISYAPDFSSADKLAIFRIDTWHDSAAVAPKAIVSAESAFDWQGISRPAIPWAETIIYEAHVKGLTQQHPDIPRDIAGTYAALAHPALIAHLQRLGISALELLPISFAADEPHLQAIGLRNYWGYNVLGHQTLNPRYAATEHPIEELQTAIRSLHAANIEVILDVVFNHSAEGDQRGATLSWRGLDNANYYWLTPAGEYENWSGCGNSFNANQGDCLTWIIDSLRYWADTFQIDGFRFDLGSILGRNPAFSPQAAFFAAIAADPVLSQLKMIAEPWDIGLGGYCLGQFPPPFAEWNGSYRDTMRSFFLRQSGYLAEFAEHFAGSQAKFGHNRRPLSASINFITAHDGFTLRDLLSYEQRHNHANGEDNRDGHQHNLSCHHGIEGETKDRDILAARAKSSRNLLATLLLSGGTPMLLAGDEFGNSQQGNNNAYCQDNPIAWLDWTRADQSLIDSTAALIALRKEIPLLRHGEDWSSANIQWLNSAGVPMQHQDWYDNDNPALAILMHRRWLVLINPQPQAQRFVLPQGQWQLVFAGSDISDFTYTQSVELTPMEVRVLRQ